MIISCRNRKLDFTIDAPPSKSIYHRELIIRFLSGDYAHLAPLDSDNEDVRATNHLTQTTRMFVQPRLCSQPSVTAVLEMPQAFQTA